MELIFKAKFLREARAMGNKHLAEQLRKIFVQIEKAESPTQIGGLVKLRDYAHYYRIRIKVSDVRDYRLVLSIRKNTVWVERIGLAHRIFYKR